MACRTAFRQLVGSGGLPVRGGRGRSGVCGSSSPVRWDEDSGRMQELKPTEQDKAEFRSVIPADPAVVVKPMFGTGVRSLNGSMFAGLFGSTIGVRLVEDPADGSWRWSTAAGHSGRNPIVGRGKWARFDRAIWRCLTCRSVSATRRPGVMPTAARRNPHVRSKREPFSTTRVRQTIRAITTLITDDRNRVRGRCVPSPVTDRRAGRHPSRATRPG